jgi:membrane protease YdiL (CAAX protease family)
LGFGNKAPKDCKMTNGMFSTDDQPQPEEIPQPGDPSMNSEMPPPLPRRRSTLRVAVSCFFIIAAVVLTQISQFGIVKKPADSVRDISLQLMGKYFVGTKVLLGKNQLLDSRFESMQKELQKKDTQKQLLLVPILAELSGKEAALAELKRLTTNPADGSVARDALLFMQLYRDGETSLAPQQRVSLQRYGWFSQLALSQVKVASDPARKAILQSSLYTVFVIVVFTLGIFAAIVAGLILLIVAIVLLAKGRLRSRLAMPENPGVSLLEAFAIYLAGFTALPVLFLWLFPGSRLGAITLAVLPVIVAAFWPRLRESDWKNCRMALGWHRGQGVFREIGAGILGYIAGLPLILAAGVFVGIISRNAGKTPVHPIIYEISRGPFYLLAWTLLACVWAPIVEEFFFRGALFGYFRRHFHWAISGIIVGLLFAIIHPQGWVGVPLLATIGFILSAIREWRGSIIASISAHALNNTTVVLFLILAVA